jgi:hypothetical protein
MPDVEKVINGLEQFIADFKPFCGNKSDWQRVDDALALLKAQEPVEPVRNKEGVYHCGSCGKACVGYEAEHSHSIIKVENYCHKCGRKVEWE